MLNVSIISSDDTSVSSDGLRNNPVRYLYGRLLGVPQLGLENRAVEQVTVHRTPFRPLVSFMLI